MKYRLYDKVKSVKILGDGIVVVIKSDNNGNKSIGYHYVVSSNGQLLDLKEDEIELIS